MLRKERFGALYYSRRDFSFRALPPRVAQLLLAALGDSALQVYARRPESSGMDELSFAWQIARWQKRGMLDAEFRCPAQLVDGERRHRTLSAPTVAHLQLTEACNLRCRHCYTETHSKPVRDELSAAEWGRLCAQLQHIGTPLVVLAGGEPLLRPDLQAILASCADHELDVWVCTNGTLIDDDVARMLVDSGVRGVNLSLDGARAEVHDALRGRGTFSKACRGARALRAAGLAEVKLRVTVTALNVDHLADFAALALNLGVHKVVFKPFQMVGTARQEQALLLDCFSFRRAKQRLLAEWPVDATPIEVSDGMPTRVPAWTRMMPPFSCVGGTTLVTVTPVGQVVACGCHVHADDWSLRDHSFEEIWNHSPLLTRWTCLPGNPRCRSCRHLSRCGGGCRVRALASGGSINDPDPWMPCDALDFDASDGAVDGGEQEEDLRIDLAP